MAETAKAKKLDVRGEVCPYPMMKASEAMQKAFDIQEHEPEPTWQSPEPRDTPSGPQG